MDFSTLVYRMNWKDIHFIYKVIYGLNQQKICFASIMIPIKYQVKQNVKTFVLRIWSVPAILIAKKLEVRNTVLFVKIQCVIKRATILGSTNVKVLHNYSVRIFSTYLYTRYHWKSWSKMQSISGVKYKKLTNHSCKSFNDPINGSIETGKIICSNNSDCSGVLDFNSMGNQSRLCNQDEFSKPTKETVYLKICK